MTPHEFFDAVSADAELRGLSITEVGPPAFIVEHIDSGFKTRIRFSAINGIDWANLRAVITGRDPNPIVHVARITGYYSQVSNWNKSKLGELAARHRGNYRV